MIIERESDYVVLVLRQIRFDGEEIVICCQIEAEVPEFIKINEGVSNDKLTTQYFKLPVTSIVA